MKSISIVVLSLLCFSLYAFAQSSPVAVPAASAVVSAQPAVTAAPVVAPVSAAPMSNGLIAIVIALVLGLNTILSTVQKVFGSLAKSEPGWLTTLSSIVLEIAKFLGSNPTV